MRITRKQYQEVVGALVCAGREDLVATLAAAPQKAQWKRKKGPEEPPLWEYRSTKEKPHGSGWKKVVRRKSSAAVIGVDRFRGSPPYDPEEDFSEAIENYLESQKKYLEGLLKAKKYGALKIRLGKYGASISTNED